MEKHTNRLVKGLSENSQTYYKYLLTFFAEFLDIKTR